MKRMHELLGPNVSDWDSRHTGTGAMTQDGDENLWSEQERSLRNDVPDCYGFNLEHSCCSEFGSVELSR